MLFAERAIKANLNKTVFAACRIKIINSFFYGVANGTHCNNNVFGVRSAVVVKKFIVRAYFGVDFVHVFFHNCGKGIIKFVASLACLEENIRVLCGSACYGVIGVKRIFAKSFNGVKIRKIFKLFVIPDFNFLNLVRGTEAVKEMNERNAAFYCRKVGNRGKIHNLLRVAGAKHGKTGLAAGIDIRMIAENAKRMGSKGSCGNIYNGRKQFTRHFIHVRNHKKKSLRSGEGGSKRACRKRAVNGACRACFRLHFGNLYFVAENICSSCCGPFIGKLSHY